MNNDQSQDSQAPQGDSTPETSQPESASPAENANASEATSQDETGQTSATSETPAATGETSPASTPAAETPATETPAADAPAKPKVLIGTQRPEAASRPAPQVKPVTPVDKPAPAAPANKGPVPKPAKMSEELDAEVEAALGGASLDQLMGSSGASEQEIEFDTRRRGIVQRIHGDDVFFSLGVRSEGVASLRQFKEPPAPGAQLDVVVTGFNDEDGLYQLSVPGGAVSVQDWADVSQGATVEARITGSNTGGLECMVGNIRGFIPASQIATFRVENFGDYVNQKLPCVVTEANPRRKNLVLSHRAILEREQEEDRKKALEEIEPGDIRDGVVRKIQPFGAFVDIGGVDGLVHVSKLSWDRVDDPGSVVEVGQKIKVKVEKIDKQTGKISLSLRDTMDNPWDGIDAKYPIGDTVTGSVTRTAEFGAFVKLEPGVEGLIHVSEIAHHRVVKVANHVKRGQDVTVKVVSVDRDSQRIGLSLKATQAAPEVKTTKKPEEEIDDTPRELAVRPRDEPLKGGRDKSSGGEQFGLNW